MNQFPTMHIVYTKKLEHFFWGEGHLIVKFGARVGHMNGFLGPRGMLKIRIFEDSAVAWEGKWIGCFFVYNFVA